MIRTGKITPFATVADTGQVLNEDQDRKSKRYHVSCGLECLLLYYMPIIVANIILPGSGGSYMIHHNRKRPHPSQETVDLKKEIETNWRLSKALNQKDKSDQDDYEPSAEDEEDESDSYSGEDNDMADEEDIMAPKTRKEIERIYEDDGIETNYKVKLE